MRGIALVQNQQFSSSAAHTSATDSVFGPFRLSADGTLLRGMVPVHLPPKELAALRLLLENFGKIVTPQQLRTALWGEVHVTDDSIPKCLSSLRAHLGPEEYIQTIYKQGYKLSVATPATTDAQESKPLPRLTILPFATEFGVPEYLGTHTAEEAMTLLVHMDPPLVITLARDSVFTLARRGLSALEVGRLLQADLALAGTIRTLPGHYRFRIELIRVADGAQVWVEDMLIEHGRTDGLESELARQLLFHLRASLSQDAHFAWSATTITEDRQQELDTPQHREAYEIYQHAHHEWQSLQRHRMQDGLQRLQRATEIDPSLTEARVDLVELSIAQELYGFMAPTIVAELVQRAASQIPHPERSAPRILPQLGWINFHVHRDLSNALQLFALSAHLPHESWITASRILFTLSRRRFDEALEILDTAIQSDPFSPALHARRAWALHLKGDAEASVWQMRQTLEKFPEQESLALYAAMIFAYNGMPEEAVNFARDLARHQPYFDPAMATHAYALATAGKHDEARQILERLQWLSRERFVISSFTPAAWVALGDFHAALEALSSADQARCPWFFSALADPRLAPLATYPEFQKMQQMAEELASNVVYC